MLMEVILKILPNTEVSETPTTFNNNVN